MSCIGTGRHTFAHVLIRIRKVRSVVMARSHTQIVRSISVLIISQTAILIASVVSTRTIPTVRAFRYASMIVQESKRAAWAKFNTRTVSCLA